MSTQAQPLLLEIGTEELPANSLARTVAQLAKNLDKELADAGLPGRDSQVFATPRRLAVLVQGVPQSRSGKTEMRMGPAIKVARNEDGSWTQAAKGFAKGCGATVEQLQVVADGKTERIACEVSEAEQAAVQLLPQIVKNAVSQLNFARSMRWGSNQETFLRPVQWLLLLHGTTPVEFSMFNITSGSLSYGHRYHHPQAITIEHAEKWQQQLYKAKVVACLGQREQSIRQQLAALAKKLGYTLYAPEELVQEVTALVEWPVVINGSFAESYLKLPQQILLSVMQKHQRYFPLYKDKNKQQLAPAFLAVAALQSTDSKVVVRGNENVLRPRLSDAEFFWGRDAKRTLEQRLEELEDIIFHAKLGSIADRSRQIAATAAGLAQLIGADAKHAERAGQLCKCDLVSATVGEFPELQGIIGGLLAVNDGEDTQVAQAIGEHYKPIHAMDSIPATPVGLALALADKLNLLASVCKAEEMPTSDKDPHAVRRAAIGILRIIIEGKLDISLKQLLSIAIGAVDTSTINLDASDIGKLLEFCHDRLRVICIEDGAPPQVVDAVLAAQGEQVLDVTRRIAAMQQFIKMPESAKLIAANKRVRNILRKADMAGVASVDKEKLQDPAESDLAAQITKQQQQCQQYLKQQDYPGALQNLAAMQAEVDAFFDGVKVMADDPGVRRNRLALLQSLANVFATVADLTRLDG